MAFYFLVESKVDIELKDIQRIIDSEKYKLCDFFPVITSGPQNCRIGIAISKANLATFNFPVIKDLLTDFIKLNFTVRELYNDSPVELGNIDNLNVYFSN